MEPPHHSGRSDGRILVSTFLGIMAALFALSGIVFEPSPPRTTMMAIAGVMLVGSIVGFVLALRARKTNSGA